MNLRVLLLPASLLLSTLAHGDTLGPYKVGNHGQLQIGDIRWEVIHFDDNWKYSSQRGNVESDNTTVTEGRELRLDSTFKTDSGSFEIDTSYSLTSATTLHYQTELQAKSPVSTKSLDINLTLPLPQFSDVTLKVGEQDLPIPEAFKEQTLLKNKPASELTIPTSDGLFRISGNLKVTVLDGRHYNKEQIMIRLAFEPSRGALQQSTFAATLNLEPYRTQAINLAPVANRSLIDDTANDYQGGWTDQGPQNDLRTFPGGSQKFGGVAFDLPANTPQQKAVIALCSDTTYQLPNTITAPVHQQETPHYLYLLHASAHPVYSEAYSQDYVTGSVTAHYKDGTSEAIKVVEQRDIGNWWKPHTYENASVVWTGDNVQSYVGLYLSRFALAGKPLEKLTFRSEGTTLWLVVGAATSQAPIPLPKETPHFVYADENWKPFTFDTAIKKGSALDFSHYSDAPAGKYGRVITTPEGHFAFEKRPDQRVRFLGTNVNWTGNYPSREEANLLVDRLKRQGYNCLRLHHYDVHLSGVWNPKEYIIREDWLDRMDYLVHVCKEAGIYISTDLFTFRRITHPDLQRYEVNAKNTFKALIPIHPAAMAEWKRFARDIMTHRNPYTGMTWAEDPAIFAICPVNEDTIYSSYNNVESVRALYDQAYEKWKLSHPANGLDRREHFNEFLADIQMQTDRELRRFLHEELGVKALLTGNNWKVAKAQTPIREQYDYVDNHCYWDHPSFPKQAFRLPHVYSQRSAVAHLAGVPREVFLTRVPGIPFTVTEFNFVYPNQYRYESGPLVGTFAALQDWDGLFRFAWCHGAHHNVELKPIESFSITSDPIQLLSERVINFLYLRGDIPPFNEEAIYTVTRDTAFEPVGSRPMPVEFPENATLLGLTHKVGSRYVPDADAASANERFAVTPQERYAVENGESRFILEKAGNFLVKSPQSTALVLKTHSLDETFVSDFDTPCMVFCGALDGNPLASSERLLLFHLTNVLNTGIEFGDGDMKNVIQFGHLPLLARTGKATIRVPNQQEMTAIRLFALDMNGERLREVPFTLEDGFIQFEASVIVEGEQPTFAYELIRSNNNN